MEEVAHAKARDEELLHPDATDVRDEDPVEERRSPAEEELAESPPALLALPHGDSEPVRGGGGGGGKGSSGKAGPPQAKEEADTASPPPLNPTPASSAASPLTTITTWIRWSPLL
jgi:hypothetical protein